MTPAPGTGARPGGATGPTPGWGLLFDAPVGYEAGLRLQERLHRLRLEGRIPDVLVALQHRPTVTLGRRGRTEHLNLPAGEYARRGIDLVRASRGGDVTYHGPGQWVLYPILHLGGAEADARGHLWNLEEIAIRTCANFGVEAGRREGKSGAWTRAGKIAAIGFHIKRWVTLHGMSFNVEDPGPGFATIVPCGLTGEPVAGLRTLLGDATPPPAAVRAALVEHAQAVLRRAWTLFREDEPWPEPIADAAPRPGFALVPDPGL